MVPQDNFGVFQQKLSGYYEKFRIRPEKNWYISNFSKFKQVFVESAENKINVTTKEL